MDKITVIEKVDIYLNPKNQDLGWKFVNKNFTGEESLPLSYKPSEDHQSAAYNIPRGGRYSVEIEINSDGTWQPVKFL